MRDRGHDIVGGNRLAIVEGHAFAQLEHPLLGAVGGSKLSARSGTTLPLESISVRLLDKVPHSAVR